MITTSWYRSTIALQTATDDRAIDVHVKCETTNTLTLAFNTNSNNTTVWRLQSHLKLYEAASTDEFHVHKQYMIVDIYLLTYNYYVHLLNYD